jgi:hypothetical protein
VSSANDILGAIGLRQQPQFQPTLGTGQQPGGPNAAQSLSSRFNTVFKTTFSSQMATVLERGEHGDFDDPTLRLQEQAALERLRRAQESQQASGTGSTTGTGSTGATGANAGPDAAGATGGGANAGPATGTNGSTGAADGASQLQPQGTGSYAAEMRDLYNVRVKQSEARLQNISRSLRAEYPKAAQLASASTGTWDPETFVPKTRDEAEAFAQRMVIDATEAAARLEIVQTMRDSARFEAQATGSQSATALVTQLDAEYERQKAYVDKLARIVDDSSNGAVTSAGSAAMRGETQRDANDLPVEEIVKAMRQSGMSEAAIKRVVGAGELAVDEDVAVKQGRPGGSAKLQAIKQQVSDFTWVNRFNLQEARFRQELVIQERERQEEQAQADRRADEKRQDERAAEKRQARRAQSQQSLEAHAQQRRAEFDAWMQQLANEAQQRHAS